MTILSTHYQARATGGGLMIFRRLGVTSAFVAVTALTACGGGISRTMAPSQADNTNPRSMSAHARRVSTALSAANAESQETHIRQEAARGARIFRIEQVAVVDPVTHKYFVVIGDQVKKTARGVVVYPGPNKIELSPQARILATKSYGYAFRHGSERDPDPSLHPVRIR